jgi:hypothetical protein
MSDNPYQSPQGPCERATPAPELSRVIRVFRLLGWVALLVFLPWLLTSLALSAYEFCVADQQEWRVLPGLNFGLAAANSYLIALLVTAHRMSRGHARAKRLAQSLCCIMLLGFPLFTLVGLILLRDIHRHYDAFCRAVTEGNSA